MEQTTTMIIFGVITVLAGGIIIFTANNLMVSSERWCSDEPLCADRSDSYCSGDSLISCSLDDRGCVVANTIICSDGCSEGVCE